MPRAVAASAVQRAVMLVMSRAESRARLPSGKVAASSNRLEVMAEMLMGRAVQLVLRRCVNGH